MSTLYRKYRPQTFKSISGQTHITSTLKQAVLKDKISHAYLFQGPRGTGKTTTARVLAKRLNCLEPQSEEPCTTCQNCQSAQENRMIDLIEIDAASNRGIDDIRALRETIGLSPSTGKYKIYIIDEVHMLTNEAFAALLKTLEEPVKHAIFILATTELHKVPPTILSRCQVYRFKRASSEEMTNRLKELLEKEKRKADPEAVDFIVQRSDGCYRDAESLLGQMLTFYEDKLSRDTLSDFLGLPSPDIVENLIKAMVNKDTNRALEVAHNAYESGFDPEQLIEEAIRFSRDNALSAAKSAPDTPVWLKDGKTAALLPNIIRAFLQALQDLSYVPQPMMALQLAILTICGSNNQTPKTPPSPAHNPAQPSKPAPVYPQKEETTPVVEDAPLAQTGQISIDTIKSSWNRLIEAIKASNPVSSTFLRATEPVSVEGNTLNLRAYYPLHQNFFNKPENKILVEQKLGEIIKTAVKISCTLEQAPAPSPQPRQLSRNEDLYNNVKEIFGS